MRVSRPVINKSIALLSHAARSTCSTFITQNEGESRESASERCSLEVKKEEEEQERGEVLSTVQNREERPATRVTAARSLLRSRARKKRTTFLAGNQVEPDDRSVHRERASSFSLSFPLPLIYVSIYLLSLLSCNVLC